MTYYIYAIAKPNPKLTPLVVHYQRQCQQFGAKLSVLDINPKGVHTKQSYTKALQPYLRANTLALALHPMGNRYTSESFSQLLSGHARVHFFIAGAFGFAPEFLNQCTSLSLSALTFSHEIAKLVLCEQIFRALSLLNHHPYHK
ncbi:23S rRNA (pseudouridine(1915)-N(3))-methyltransferase RlmH [Helicobacter baculiformis]|uniref:Ribosomal RNA large subunit methyltransferase H n=1 Tax=Helicobacter baculiformis TaxID=427351 RepID=A0ABV7ZLX0_9HELI|nr:23S rRNA (pseudouridine(1915)-N(3))-methyltransferase RlmH [Helicobacter baculiformis]